MNSTKAASRSNVEATSSKATPRPQPPSAAMQAGTQAATQAILPVDVPNTPHRWARGVRAGRWLFATGQCGTDYIHGLAPEVLQTGHPFDGPSKAHREARRLFRNVDEVLTAGGSNPAEVV